MPSAMRVKLWQSGELRASLPCVMAGHVHFKRTFLQRPCALAEERILNLCKFHGRKTCFVVVRHMIDPCGWRIPLLPTLLSIPTLKGKRDAGAFFLVAKFDPAAK